jgi:hypothetical protein
MVNLAILPIKRPKKKKNSTISTTSLLQTNMVVYVALTTSATKMWTDCMSRELVRELVVKAVTSLTFNFIFIKD